LCRFLAKVTVKPIKVAFELEVLLLFKYFFMPSLPALSAEQEGDDQYIFSD